MPIHDLSYQHWHGVPELHPPAWILARAQLQLLWKRKSVRGLLLVSAIATLFVMVMIYLEIRLPQSGSLRSLSQVARVDGRILREFLVRQRLVHLLLCIAAGSDLIALDRRHRALQIYLARPLRGRDYVLGKGLALALLLSLTSWIPALFLVALKSTLTQSFAWMDPWLPLSILGYSAALVLVCTALTLAVSSLSSSPRLASGQLFAFVALSGVAAQVLATLTREPRWQTLSLGTDLDQVASSVFAAVPRYDVPVWQSWGALLLLALASAAVLKARIRAIDVVGGS